MKIAIIGAGISGLVAAHHLNDGHEITVFEALDHAGGHTNTVDVEIDDERHAVDTGFIVFNDRTYPSFIRLLETLGVASHPSTMSFSVRCDRSGLEYNGTSINRLFAQRSNLLRPRFYRMIKDIIRFNRDATAQAESLDDATTVDQFLAAGRYGAAFVEHYLVPMGAAIWSCPVDRFRDFPVRFVVEFFRNHGMLSVNDRPQWRVVTGGSARYVEALTRRFRAALRLSTPVRSVTRGSPEVLVTTDEGPESFDHVIFACHSDQALSILGDASPLERRVLGAFPYQRNEAVLHTDARVLPRRRLAWASWNYHVRADRPGDRVAVTYNMNMLQGLTSRYTFCVTLNDDEGIDPAKVIRRIVYHHPVFTTARAEAQRRHGELIGVNRTSYCGAYWGYGFHEDGVNSALRVVEGLRSGVPPRPAVRGSAR